jgi:hypothetical protein
MTGVPQERTNLPRHEADGFYNRGLDDFFSGEYTPCHGVWTFRMGVGPQVTILVDGIIRDVPVPLDVREKKG